MCRSIKPLNNFAPAATEPEMRAAALQYVRKVAGTTKPAAVNEAAFAEAVAQITSATRDLLTFAASTAPPKDRAVEAAKVRARSELRYR